MAAWIPLAAAGIGALGSWIGSKFSSSATEKANRQNAALQREFAQNGIRWKVADAKAAGIHPLYALGAGGYSASPSYVGDQAPANLAASMGQDVSRAIHATRTEGERADAVTGTLRRLQVENAGLQNDFLRAQIAKINSSQVGPPLPSNSAMPGLVGQGNYVSEVPLERVHSAPGKPHQEVGQISDVGFAKTPTGLTPVPSKDVKERIEDQMIPEIGWAIRNQLLPYLGQGDKPSKSLLPKGTFDWEWNPWKAEWQPSIRAGRSVWKQFKDWYNK